MVAGAGVVALDMRVGYEGLSAPYLDDTLMSEYL